MPATVQGNIYNGSGPTSGSAEGGITWGRDDNVTSTAVLPIPATSGTFFTYPKTFAIAVTGGTLTNHISNRRALLSAAMPTGVHEWWQNLASYSQATAPASVDAGIDNGVPSGYSGGSGVGGEVTTTPSQWDNTSAITTVGQNGAFIRCAIGCDSTYAGGGGNSSLPSLILEYDEGP